MTNVQLLRAKIVERNTTQGAVADSMGINRSTFCRKMKENGKSFTVGEVQALIEILNLTIAEVVKIFFASKVA